MPFLTNVEKLTCEELSAYLKRIKYRGGIDSLNVDVETLFQLHRQHTLEIPFENVTLHLGSLHDRTKPLDISMPTVFNKIVKENRGGYCFEMNKLFAAVLVTIGFEVYSHKAGVVWGFDAKRPLSHRMLTVDINGEKYQADVGFGGAGQIYPLKLVLDEKQIQGPHIYKLVLDKDKEYELLKMEKNGWQSLYAFDHRKCFNEADYDENNLITSTDPNSIFVKEILCTKPLENGRVTFFKNKLKHLEIIDGEEEMTSIDVDPSERLLLLKEHFGIELQTAFISTMVPAYVQYCAEMQTDLKPEGLSVNRNSSLAIGNLTRSCL